MERFAKSNGNVAIKCTVVGFGQGGCRVADLFAAIRDNEGNRVYNVLGFNSNDGDFGALRYIDKENLVSLGTGGFGKDPEAAIRYIESNDEAKEKIKRFVSDKIRVDDEMVLFITTAGGGTGTSTIEKTIEEFNEYHNASKLKAVLKELIQKHPDQWKSNKNALLSKAFKESQKTAIKIGVIYALPVRHDGPEVLRQVNDFAARMWENAQKPGSNIAFTMFPDNQYMKDIWEEEKASGRKTVDNYRDFVNERIVEVFHELNAGVAIGGTDVVFDPQDFRKIILDKRGNLVVGKLRKSNNEIKNTNDLIELVKDSITSPYLHEPVRFEVKTASGETELKEVQNVGLFTVIPKGSTIDNAFIDKMKDEIVEMMPLKGTVFSGYVEQLSDFNVIAYTFYKTLALPERLQVGLVEEYETFMARTSKISSEADTIQRVEAIQEDEYDLQDFDIDLSDLGIDIDDEVASSKELEQEIDLENINLDEFDLDDEEDK